MVNKASLYLLVLFVAAELVACSGGGSGATITTTPAAMPTITNISPASGPLSGGTVVTITGTNFTGATGVTFDGSAGTNLNLSSSSQLTVTTPAGTPGAKDVGVTTPSSTATSNAAFTYYVPSSISTFAGTTAGLSGDGGAATSAQLFYPNGVALDSTGNLYIADDLNHRIRVVAKVDGTYFGVAMTAGNIYTIAGTTGGLSGDGGAATAAQLYDPAGVAFDSTGNLYIADLGNTRIRVVAKVDGTYFGVAMTAGNIYTVAGTTPGLSGDGGASTAAKLNAPYGMAFDSTGNIYIGDASNHRIRVVAKADGTYFGVAMTAGNIYTVAGTTLGLSGDGGAATSAQLYDPTGVAFDSAGNLYIADQNNHRIRVVAKANGTYFGMAMTAGNIYTVAGTTLGLSGDGGAATSAQLYDPTGVAFDSAGNLYIADQNNYRIRVVAKADGIYFGVSITAGNIYTVAGTTAGLSGDGGAPTLAQLFYPTGVAFDSTGNLFIADKSNNRIRKVTP
jgi:sugar lactone lactonase YvrE